VSNTPIFDELYREYKSAGKDYDRLATPYLQKPLPLSEMAKPEYEPDPILDAPVKKIGHWLKVPEQLTGTSDLMLRFKEAVDNAQLTGMPDLMLRFKEATDNAQLPVIPDLMLRFKEAADNARVNAEAFAKAVKEGRTNVAPPSHIVRKIDPVEIFDEEDGTYKFLHEMLNDFYRTNPGYTGAVEVSESYNIDLNTSTVTMKPSRGVKLRKPPADVLYISEEALSSPEPVTYDELVDAVQVVQESKHRLGESVKAAINTYHSNEQTDEAVNAALLDAKTRSTPIPAGLMVFDEEVADEE
jgi:hypothetical protein